MRIKNIACLFVFLFCFTSYSYAQSEDKVSIALISDKASDLSKSPIVSLLEVELSQKEGIQLLERAEIDKIMEEQRLSAVGLLDRSATIKIGKLLRADAFLILSLESRIQDANDLIRVRFAETAHGLRLMDYFEQSESSNPEEAIGRIMRKIERLLNKISQPDEKLIPVGIVDIHRVELGEKYKMLERTLPTMLSVRLGLEPQIIMLEREDLKVLLDEKLRTEGEDSNFWNSAILIDGYIQPNNGQLQMHLNLKQPGGTVLKSIIVPVEPNDPTIAIDKAVAEINKNLNDSPPSGKWNPGLEAAQFYKQGQMLNNHERYDEAIPVFEAAYALEPNNIYYIGALFERIWNKGSDRGLYSDLEIANMVSILVRQIRDNYEKGLLSASRIPSNFTLILGCCPFQGYFGNGYSVKTEEIKRINHENRKIWTDTVEDALQKQITGSDYPQNIGYIADIASLSWIESDEPNEVIKNIKKTFDKYIMPLELGGSISSDSDRKFIYDVFFLDIYNNPIYMKSMNQNSYLKGSWGETKKLIDAYLEELSEIKDPVVGIQSKLILFSDYQTYIDDLRKEFKTSKMSNSNYVSEAMIGLYGKINTNKIQYEERIGIWEEFCGYIIDNNDIDALTSLLVTGYVGPFNNIFNNIKTHTKKYANSMTQQILDSERADKLYMQYYSLLIRVEEKLDKNSNNNDIITALKNLRGLQNEIKKHFSQEPLTESEKPFNVTMILSQKDWPVKFKSNANVRDIPIHWFRYDIQNEMLWVAMALHNRGVATYIGLAGINLKQKNVLTLWQAEIIKEIDINKSRAIDRSLSRETALFQTKSIIEELSSFVVCSQNSYISLKGKGILVLPGSLQQGKKYFENPKILTQDDGLPSPLITSIAKDQSKDSGEIWVAYGGSKKESGLGIYDTETKGWETVFCSTLNGEPPFNSGFTYMIEVMEFIKPDQLFFEIVNVDFRGSGGSLGKYWLLDTSTYKVSKTKSKLGNSYFDVDHRIYESMNNNIFKKNKIVDRKILNGEYAWVLLETSYGLVAIGEGAVGLIEAKE